MALPPNPTAPMPPAAGAPPGAAPMPMPGPGPVTAPPAVSPATPLTPQQQMASVNINDPRAQALKAQVSRPFPQIAQVLVARVDFLSPAEVKLLDAAITPQNLPIFLKLFPELAQLLRASTAGESITGGEANDPEDQADGGADEDQEPEGMDERQPTPGAPPARTAQPGAPQPGGRPNPFARPTSRLSNI